MKLKKDPQGSFFWLKNTDTIYPLRVSPKMGNWAAIWLTASFFGYGAPFREQINEAYGKAWIDQENAVRPKLKAELNRSVAISDITMQKLNQQQAINNYCFVI
ncbi:MAG: hypothetical protein WC236_11400 [Gallionellaceae bacterium]|jgi:hypothetical protein